MALRAPVRSWTGSLTSYSPHEDIPLSSPNCQALRSQYTTSAGSDGSGLRPNSFSGPSFSHLLSPSSDMVGPSPVTSNGTEATEIEDDIAEETAQQAKDYAIQPQPQLMMLKTNLPDHVRKATGEEIVSVIHAPEGFDPWKASDTWSRTSMSNNGSTIPSGVLSPPPSEPAKSPPSRDQPTVVTNIRPAAHVMDAQTPQAQSLPDILFESARVRSSSTTSLEQIPESHETDAEDGDVEDDMFDSNAWMREDSEIKALRTALEECWTLCNTLANLSSIHRERIFNSSGTADAHEKAWKCCWKLCKRLYQSRDDVSDSFNMRTNLDLCRDFCQSLFDVRTKRDETADSVLRVSFELNTHLYSAQDSRNLPEAFRERTLDFYITMCHRLMKQRSELAEETDSLLRACWSLAEILFRLRQTRRDGKAVDEELLGSAVQACWELCDMFREGWTQIRPDRGTRRPHQANFFAPSSKGSEMSAAQAEARSQAGSRAEAHSHPQLDSMRSVPEAPHAKPARAGGAHQGPALVPETPVTEFEDTPVSPESASPPAPNILVLGAPSSDRGGAGARRGAWSSSASNLSSYSKSSAHTSSTGTATTATLHEGAHITRIKVLVVKAAMNIGFNRDDAERAISGSGCTNTSTSTSTSTSSNNNSTAGGQQQQQQQQVAALQSFVKSLPTGSFGSLPAHATLLQSYKKLVLADAAFRASAPGLPPRGKRVSGADMARSIAWMTLRSGQYGFLRDLFRVVFGFQVEDAEARRNVTITV